MRQMYAQYAVVTACRPTFFLTPDGEKTSDFREAWIGVHEEAVRYAESMTGPEKFEPIRVTVSVEV